MNRERKSNKELWGIGYAYAYNYYKNHGNLIMPAKYVIDGYRLGAWICSQRTAYKTGKMNQERINRLNRINMIWDLYEYQCMDMYKKACEYYVLMLV